MATKQLSFANDHEIENLEEHVNPENFRGEPKVENKIGLLALNSPKLIEFSTLSLFGGDESNIERKMKRLSNFGASILPRRDSINQSKDNTTVGKQTFPDQEQKKRTFPIYNYQPSPYPKDLSSDEEEFDQCNYTFPRPELEKPKRVPKNDRVSQIRRTLMRSNSRSGRKKFSKGKTFGANNPLSKSLSRNNSLKKQGTIRSILKKGLTKHSRSSMKRSNSQKSQFKKVGFETKKTVFCYNPRKKIRIAED